MILAAATCSVPFARQGKMIRRVSLERQDDQDDDWIVLEFSSDDPAAADFRVPNAEGSEV